MQNRENKRVFDIHERIYRWVVSVIQFTKKLPKTPQNNVIAYQLTRSATSVGANDREADACNSRKDFIAKYVITRKECHESNYWLRLSMDTNPLTFAPEVEKLIIEGREIFAIVSTIIKNATK